MLNICEMNEYLYRHLDRENKKKDMVNNYGSYLRHSNEGASSQSITEQANAWLAHFNDMINDDKSELNKSSDSAKAAAEALIPECSKILRKVNAQNAGKDLAKKLVDARKSLEDIREAAIAHSAMLKEQESLQHGEKWRKHKYIAIENGRYIYPEDLNKELAKKGSTTVQKKLNTLNNAKETANNVAKLTGNTDTAKSVANNMYGVNDAKKDLAQTIKAENLMRDVVKTEKNNKVNKREQVLSEITKSEPVQNYAKAIAKAYEDGLIRKRSSLADFDPTNDKWRDDPRYDALLEAANKAEEYCKKAGEESEDRKSTR